MSINYQDVLSSANGLTNNIFSAGWSASNVSYTFLLPTHLPDYYYSSIIDESPAAWFGLLSDVDVGVTLDASDFDSFRDRQIEAVDFMLGTSASFDLLSSGYRVSFSDVINLTFSPSSEEEPGEITFLNADIENNPETEPNPLLGQTRLPGDISAGMGAGDVFIDRNIPQNLDSSINIGDIGFWALMHELGHAAGGLDHISGEFDNQKYTIMSYEINDLDFGTSVRPYTLQLLDIAALQEQYGERNYATRGADGTVYGPGQGFLSDPSQPFMYTIWDGGGVNDTIDAAGYDVAAQIEFAAGSIFFHRKTIKRIKQPSCI